MQWQLISHSLIWNYRNHLRDMDTDSMSTEEDQCNGNEMLPEPLARHGH